MPRIARDVLRILPIEPSRDRVQPPDNLSETEAQLFREVVASCPVDQFGPADVYLLSSFVRITIQVERAFDDLNKARPKERPQRMKLLDMAVKAQASLAVRLRLSTSSRGDARKLGRQHAMQRTHPAPWEA
jgi:hypothetical protein